MITYKELKECKWDKHFKIKEKSDNKIVLEVDELEIHKIKYKHLILECISPKSEWIHRWDERTHEWIQNLDYQYLEDDKIIDFFAKVINKPILLSFGIKRGTDFFRWGFSCKDITIHIVN